jgi:AraC-like DNA-binding protein
MDAGLYKSIVWVHALVGVLARHSIDRDELLRGSTLAPGLLADSRARVSLDQWRALVQRAMLLTQDPGLGITIGSTVPDNVYQIVGQIAAASASMREALREFQRYGALLGNVVRSDIVEEGDRAYLVFTPLYPNPHAPQFEAEMGLSLAYRLLRRYAKRETEDAQEVWFAHPAPAYAERYAEVFRCPVRFDRPRNAILFARRYLDEPSIYANPRLLDVLRDAAERMLAEDVLPELAERVRTMLRHEPNLGRVSAAAVARLLRLDERSLRRRLVQANARWSVLLDEARHERACEELRRGEISIRELTVQLGFSDQSAFNRAFKRWTGTTPARYSREALPSSSPSGSQRSAPLG